MNSYQNTDLLKIFLIRMYCQEKLTIKEIALFCGVGLSTIRRWLKKYEIPIRAKSKVKMGKKNPMFGTHRCQENNSNWRGGETIDKDGHVLVRKPDHPNVNKNGYVLRSHLVMEKILGRYLTLEEVVHHDNDNKADDRPENLILFPSQSRHLSYHHSKREISHRSRVLNDF